MALIDVSNLTFAYEGSYDNIFENVNFQIDTDWKLGFTGRNGRGKTTFLNLLLGKYEYSGKISANVDFRYFPYNLPNKSIDTAAVIEDICTSFQEWEIIRELSLLGIDKNVLDRPFQTLSNGEQTKVMLAALFLTENVFLLIDEPTNHLDMDGRKIVSQYLNQQHGFILVSHDRAFLDGCIDHILSINKANIDVQRGNFASWSANKERQDGFELAENEKLKKEIKRLKKAAKQAKGWADKVEDTKIGKNSKGDNRAYVGEKSRRMQKRRKNIEHRQQSAFDEKSELLKNIEQAEPLKITQLPYHKSLYISMYGVNIFYDNPHDMVPKQVCCDINISLESGDRVALHGKNGSGKSSILKLICGEDISYTGELAIGSGLKISYVSQDTSFLSGSLTEYALKHGIDESLFKAILRKLDFSRVQFEKNMEDFSAGQKKKVLIAKSLCEKAHLLVWDEPLNFVDVLSRIQIEELLLQYKPTILFTEHDRIFCEKVANKTYRL
ncbi:MAG: ABC-F type ribosomal protection protein [Defluviitaleaceae bacterium]|nr:ABC-F type ribosomal protection protein [Defluviitaleaceae bacterium]